MPGKKNRKRRPTGSESRITARPKSGVAEVTVSPIPDPGLSVEVEDLGVHFLTEATGQSNFESMLAQPPELSIVDGASTDDPLVGPNFDPDHSVWEQTVDWTLQSSGGALPGGGESGASDKPAATRNVKRRAR